MKTMLRSFVIIITTLGLFLIGFGSYSIINVFTESRFGKPYVYDLVKTPGFLTDDLAVSKARQTLVYEGYPVEEWEPRFDGRTKDPFYHQDLFLQRNSLDPNVGTVLFVKKHGYDARAVSVKLIGQRVVCQVLKPK